MACASYCRLTSVLAVAGLMGLGFGGYNLISTGCPLGMCRDEAAAVTPVANSTIATTEACPLSGDGLACPDKGVAEQEACCPAELTQPVVVTPVRDSGVAAKVPL